MEPDLLLLLERMKACDRLIMSVMLIENMRKNVSEAETEAKRETIQRYLDEEISTARQLGDRILQIAAATAVGGGRA